MLGPDRSHSVTPCIPQTPQPKMVKKQRINYKASLNLNTQKLQVSLSLPLSILFLTTLSSSLPSPQLKIPFPRKGVPPNRNGDYSFRWLKNSEEGTIIYFCPVSPTLIRRLGSQDKSLGWGIKILSFFLKWFLFSLVLSLSLSLWRGATASPVQRVSRLQSRTRRMKMVTFQGWEHLRFLSFKRFVFEGAQYSPCPPKSPRTPQEGQWNLNGVTFKFVCH